MRLRRNHEIRLGRVPPADHDPRDTYTEGQLVALDWLLGLENLSPLTLQLGPRAEDAREIDGEADLAADMLHGRAVMDLRGRSYVAGVEFALRWVRYETVDDEL
jgi:hypothetical protein